MAQQPPADGSAALLSGSTVPNQVVVCVLEARDLVAGDRGGSSDPFVQVGFSGQVFRTRVMPKIVGNTHWDERVAFVAARNPLTAISFTVWDRDALKKDFLGRASIDVNTLRELKREWMDRQGAVNRSMWLDLADAHGATGDFGRLRVVVGWDLRRKLPGKGRLAILSRLGVKRKAHGEAMAFNDDEEAHDGESDAVAAEDSEAEDDDPPGDGEDAEQVGVDLSSDDDYSVADGEVPAEKRPSRQQRAEAARQELAERLERARNIELKSGTWRVIFHVIELRELKAEDLQGTSDPVCTVSTEVPQRKAVQRSTSIKKGVRSCVFDEHLFLDLENMDESSLEAASFRFAVFDADLISRNDLIGAFTFNLLDIYYAPDHRLAPTWIGLIDDRNPKDAGIQGYARVGVSVLGPGDSISVCDQDEEESASKEPAGTEGEDDTIGEVLLPPNIQQELHFLRLRLYQAEDLPALDTNRVAGSDGIDAFVRAKFDGNKPFRSRVASASRPRGSTQSLRCVFNEELWLPTFNHRLAKNIALTVKDYDKHSSNDLVGTLLLNYQDVLRAPGGRIRPRWYNLYGAQSKASIFGSNAAERFMNENPAHASGYRGRLLLSLHDHVDQEDSSRLEAPHKATMRAIKRTHMPAEADYVLRFWAVAGSELPRMQGTFGRKTTSSFALGLAVGPHKLSSAAIVPQSGNARWLEAKETTLRLPSELLERWRSPKVQQLVRHLDSLRAAIRDLRADLPEDVILHERARAEGPVAATPTSDSDASRVAELTRFERQEAQLREYILDELSDAQVPDVFLYLLSKEGKSVSFVRFSPQELLLRRFDATPEWFTLAEDTSNNKLDDDDFAGSVLVSMGLGGAEEATSSATAWAPAKLQEFAPCKPYAVRVNIFQAVELPAADASSLSDPYARVTCLGEEHGIKRRLKTCDPLWYETASFPSLDLPHPTIAPRAVVKIYDYDKYDPDDWLGNARIPLAAPGATDYAKSTRPKWYPVFQVTPGDCGDAKVLASLDIFPLGPGFESPPAPRSIEPRCKAKAKLQIVVLGLRNLSPYRSVPIHNPRVEFHLGDASKSRNVHSTKNSRRPSGTNPNFGELIEIPFRMPDNLVFMPRLHITVNDSRFGGISKTTIATAAYPLHPLVPRRAKPAQVDTDRAHLVSKTASNPNLNDSPMRMDGIDGFIADAEEAAALAEQAEVAPDQACSDEDGEDDDTYLAESDYDEDGQNSRRGDFGGLEGIEEESEREESDQDEESRDESDSLASDVSGDETGAQLGFVNWPMHDPLPLPAFMKGRPTLDHELEGELGLPPFASFPLFRGQQVRTSFLGRKLKPNLRKVGTLKAVMRIVMEPDSDDESDQERATPLTPSQACVFNEDMLAKIMVPQSVHVRVHVLKGFNFVPMDIGGGKSDPYLILSLGPKTINDKKNYLDNTVSPNFYKRFDLQTELPGPSLLRIRAMDYDTFSSDDLLGETVIDLEDRWFNKLWQSLRRDGALEERTREQLSEEEVSAGAILEESRDMSTSNVPEYHRKPVELRSLWTPTSQLEQGKLELWCDIMDQATAIKYPVVDVSPPANSVYEMRVIIWKSEDVPAFDMFTKQNDLYVRANFNGHSDKWMYTDTHWRCKEGKGSWNYRLKFKDLGLPLPRLKSRLTLQIWDKDLTKWSDCIAETVLDLDSHLKAAFLRGDETYQVFSDDRQRRQRKPAPPVSTAAQTVQPQSNGGSGGVRHRRLSNLSIAVDDYTGLTATNADADDLSPETVVATPKKKPRRRVSGKATGRARAASASAAAGGSADGESAGAGEAGELIDTYMPWASDMFGGMRAPPNSRALKLVSTEGGKTRDMGKLYVSIELVRKDVAESSLSNGAGRKEPNRFPKLPKPVGRLKWSLMWNPFYMLRECLGPKLCLRFCICFFILIAIVGSVFLLPQISSFVSLVTSLGPLGYAIIGIVAALVVVSCCYCIISERVRRRSEERALEDAYDLEAQRKQPGNSAEPGADQDSPSRRCCSCCLPRRPQAEARVDADADGEVELLRL